MPVLMTLDSAFVCKNINDSYRGVVEVPCESESCRCFSWLEPWTVCWLVGCWMSLSHAGASQGQICWDSWLFVGWLVAECPCHMLVHLRVRSAETVGCLLVGWLLNVLVTCWCISGADLLRRLYALLHWKLANQSDLLSHPVIAYWHYANQYQLLCQAPGKVASGVPVFKSQVWLDLEKTPCGESRVQTQVCLTTWPLRWPSLGLQCSVLWMASMTRWQCIMIK